MPTLRINMKGTRFSSTGPFLPPLAAGIRRAYIHSMPETYKCPHCGAVYEVTHGKAVPREEHAADCQVCGKPMASRNGASIPHYELVTMPDGTSV